MTITYCRNDPVSARWVGINALLTEYQVDFNFYQHETRIATLEANYTLTVSIGTITQPAPDQLLITMTDASTRGPFDLPVATFVDRGTWAPLTGYSVNDTFDANGTLYRVLFAHTSASTFSPTANDGAGHDYYKAMLSLPGNSLPGGGATAQVLQKSSSTDYAVMWGYKLPTGGTTNQVLLKQSSTNQDAAWTTLGATMVSFHGSTASTLSSINVSDAIEEVESDVQALAATVAGLPSTISLRHLSDVNFATADPLTGAIIYFNGTSWVATASPSTGQVMKWDGSAFVGTTVSTTLAALTDVTLTSPATGNALVYNGTKWVNRNAFNDLGATSAGVIVGLSSDYAAIKCTPTGSRQILNGGYSRPGSTTTVIIVTSGTSSFNITSGSAVTMNGTLATGTVTGKVWTLTFVADSGPNLYEISRTGPM